MRSESVEQLFLRYRQHGEARALAKVFDRTAGELMRVAVHLAQDQGAAEDLVQSTFLAAIESAPRFDVQARLMPWLLGILSNHAQREWTRRNTSRQMRAGAANATPSQVALPTDATPADALQRVESLDASPVDAASIRELSAALTNALRQQRDPYRQVLELHLRHGLSPAAIADVLRRPQGTVRSQLHRGLDQLRRLLPASYASAGLSAAVVGWLQSPAAAAIKQHCVQHALHQAGLSVVSTTAVVGVIAVKNILLPIVGVLLLVVVGVFVGDSMNPTDSTNPETVEPVAAAVVASGETMPAVENEPSTRSELQPAPTEGLQRSLASREISVETTLVVHAVWKDNGEPAKGRRIGCMWISPSERRPRYGLTDEKGEARIEAIEPGHLRVCDFGGDKPEMLQVVAGSEARCELKIARGITLEGRVVDELQAPVADAEVVSGIQYMVGIPVAVVARTDAEGFFRLEGLGDGNTLSARKAGYIPSGLEVMSQLAEPKPGTKVVVFALRVGGAAVVGRVVDRAGNSVAGAPVRLGWLDTEPFRKPNGWLLPPPSRMLTADADGRFEAKGLPIGRTAVESRAAGFAAIRQEFVLLAHTETLIELALERGVTVRGTAVDGGGEPAGGARIYAGELGEYGTRSTQTNRNGSYVLADLPTGVVAVDARHPDGRRTKTILKARRGETLTWNPVLEFVGDGSISGLVVNSVGKPQPDWSLRLIGRTKRKWSGSNQAGKFRIDGLTKEGYSLELRRGAVLGSPPHRIVRGVWPSEAPITIEIDDTQLQPGGLIGRVVDSQGSPLKSPTAILWPVPGEGSRPLKVDADGGFTVRELPPGNYRLIVRTKTAGLVVPAVVVSIEPGRVLNLGELLLKPPGTVRVDAVFPNNVPLRGARGFAVLESELAQGALDSAVTVGRQLYVAAPSGQASLVVAARNGFSARLAEGTYRLRLWGENMAPIERTVEVRSGEETVDSINPVLAHHRQLRFEMPKDAPWPYGLYVSVKSNGESIYEQNLNSYKQAPYRWSAGFAPGRYLIEVETNTGLRGMFEMQVDGASSEPVEVRLR